MITPAIMKVDADKFLTELNKLYDRNKQHGSVYVTMKRSECAPCG